LAKQKNIFVCQECGNESPKWIGRCPACNNWNSYVEEIKITGKTNARHQSPENKTSRKPKPFSQVEAEEYSRQTTGIGEFDRILGGGFVPGSFTLLGGEPGIGKSTLALQLALDINKDILYVSGEESAGQIKMRADRLELSNPKCLVYNETNLDEILLHFNKEKPSVLIIDSIQTVYTPLIESAPGSVSQVRECAARLLQAAKDSSVPVLLIGHITKDGSLAGPKVLEHIVDTVIQFEGDQHLNFRILRTLKNRFGAVPELAIFEMKENGLHQILNPSAYFLHHNDQDLSGITVACTVDGYRPLLIETQALVSPAVYGTPQRSATGFDTRRLNMLLAVLEKKGKLTISNKDVFLNIAGGMKIQDTAADLAVITAIISSVTDQSVNSKTCCCAEISLTGELRPVSRIEQRIAEAKKLGFTRIVISSYHKNAESKGIQVLKASSLQEAMQSIFRSND
jgi:DNA repair protein RadA/Sms